jgi:hypothetical protein
LGHSKWEEGMNEKMPALAAYRAGKLSLPPGYHLDVDAEEPTSGLEPLTCSSYEYAGHHLDATEGLTELRPCSH